MNNVVFVGDTLVLSSVVSFGYVCGAVSTFLTKPVVDSEAACVIMKAVGSSSGGKRLMSSG